MSAMRDRERFSVALPGGSVAVNCFASLAAVPIDWRRVHFFWVDERAVPPTDPESNFALAQSLWFEPARVPSASIHRMPTDGPDLAAAVMAYSGELTRELGLPARLDFVLLGVGADGHVASLFPGHAALSDERLVAGMSDAPKPPARRLTLTLPVLGSARRLVAVAFGESKADALHEALEREHARTPLAEVLRRCERPLVLMDQGAGRRLTSYDSEG